MVFVFLELVHEPHILAAQALVFFLKRPKGQNIRPCGRPIKMDPDSKHWLYSTMVVFQNIIKDQEYYKLIPSSLNYIIIGNFARWPVVVTLPLASWQTWPGQRGH